MENSKGGSYEFYEGFLSGGDGRGLTAPAPPVAQGIPGSPQDGQQMLEELRKELGERKVREDNLLQIISEMRSCNHQMASASFGEAPFINAEGASGSPTTESQKEKLKDAHINHLQRQVTMLKANLFKAEGWTQRVSEAVREKDEAVENVRLANLQLNQVQQENEILKHEVTSLSSANQELEHKLRRMQQEVQLESFHESCQAQATKLQDRLQSARAEMTTLKESLTRLAQENKSLKESGHHLTNGQVTSPACNQELDYLHRVVDTLKNTVLEQRNFLVNMKSPQSSQVLPPSPLRSSGGSMGNSPTPQDRVRIPVSTVGALASSVNEMVVTTEPPVVATETITTKTPLQVQASAPIRKTSHSEILARRSHSDASNLKHRAKTDVMARAKGSALGAESRGFPQWMLPTSGVGAVQDLAHFQTATPTQPPLVAAGAPQYEAAAMASSVQQHQVAYVPQYMEGGALQVLNYDVMAGGRMVSNPQPSSPQLTADRLCPVCNRNFGHLSMEEFQTHVFECFDDENSPETMKPSEDPVTTTATSSGDRICPMCNTRFSSSTAQAEYEKHVHGHFGEEGPGEHFEILQP